MSSGLLIQKESKYQSTLGKNRIENPINTFKNIQLR
jgi:hypothetical protein